MQRVAVLTSGGDAPGMNAALRAVVRVGSARDLEIIGVRQGFSGLIDGQLRPLGARDVAGIIHLGGTMLGSARAPEFREPEGRDRALAILNKHRIDGIVVIGGNGSLAGAHALSTSGFPVVGVASTIDNDVNGADITIGVDTALNIALEAIDRLKTTASSHQRAFLVEVMGRNFGYLALMAGIAGGADVVVIPEVETDPDAVVRGLKDAYTLASHTGAAAVDRLVAGESGTFIALVKGSIAALPLVRVLTPKPPPDPELVKLAQLLAR
ncbi:MAG: 6-phosphofructokinase [Gemmatimonadetes bacterium]|nr:MAG: 6-phosphofructokinase [Gemmatimonadota bacterium]